MVRHTHGVVNYAPLYIHSFQLLQPHFLAEAEKFNIRYTDPAQIEHTADKLRWYRYKRALLQRDVAAYAGIDRATYCNYEETERDYYPLDKMTRIAELLQVPITELLDEYNMFLYKGQGQQIRAIRKRSGMTQAEYAHKLGIPIGTLKTWEQGRAQIFKSTWQKYFENA